MSEIYKDIEALRVIGFSEKEIRDVMKGRRAVSKDDINRLMLGVFNPEKVPAFKKDSGIRKAVDNINRELETNYTVNDFINRLELNQITNKYRNIPLGLSEDERTQFLKTTPEKKFEDLEPRFDLQEKRIEDQQGNLPKPQVPLPNIPMPDTTASNNMMASINQNTNLTRTEEALLSPDEKVIAARRRGGLGSFI